MAIRDRLNSWISYFDTDTIEEEEVSVEVEEQEEMVSDELSDTPMQQIPRQTEQVRTQPPVKAYPKSTYVPAVPPSQREKQARLREQQQQHLRAVSSLEQEVEESLETPQARIAIKYPRKYEDAQDIVDLLIVNECVLIDFQYMLDAQARRCLDFIDGASKVLFGSLQKVGASMYLLTPKNVIVDVDELTIPSHAPEMSYDYDMKRR